MLFTESTSVFLNTTPSTINVTSMDIFVTGCFNNFETVSCVRSASLTLLAVLTGVLCILKLIKFHHAHHPDWHQYFIFYCASLESAIGAVHFVLTTYVQLDFVLQWLKLTQFLVMCHFYWTLATRALRREIWATRFLIPFLIAACAYFTVIAILGVINVQGSYTECFQPYWIELSAAEFTIVQLFCVAGFYITHRLNEISTLDSVRRSQKRDLWCIVIVFEISAMVGFLYDLSVRLIGDEHTGCNDVFNYNQTVFSVVFFIFMVMKLLLPIWVMLFVFQPAPQAVVDNDDLIPALTDDGTSAFSTTIDEQYRQLYHPNEDYRSYGSESSSPNSPYGSEWMANGYKRPNSQTNLDPIKEESSAKNSIQNSSENNNSQQYTPHTVKPQAATNQSVPHQSISSSNIAQEHSSQGQGQLGSGQGQRSSETQEPRDSLKGLLSQAPVPKELKDNNPVQDNQAQKSPLPQVEIQPKSAKGEGHSPKEAVGDVQVVPKFSIQGSDEDDEESPPSPKRKFYI